MIVLFLLALPARYRDVDMRNFFKSFNQTVLAFCIIIIFTGVIIMMITVIIGVIMMIILIIGVAISPVFCFTSVGEIRVWIALRWQRLLSVATLWGLW